MGGPPQQLGCDVYGCCTLAPVGTCQLQRVVSNCLENQAVAALIAAKSGFHGEVVRTITLRTVSSFRMQATKASFFGLPAATSESDCHRCRVRRGGCERHRWEGVVERPHDPRYELEGVAPANVVGCLQPCEQTERMLVQQLEALGVRDP